MNKTGWRTDSAACLLEAGDPLSDGVLGQTGNGVKVQLLHESGLHDVHGPSHYGLADHGTRHAAFQRNSGIGAAETEESVTPEGIRKRKRWNSQRSFIPRTFTLSANGPRETLGTRGSRRAIERLVNPESILLMFQFVSHSAQQMRHAKGLLESLPCPEEFRDIQDILFFSCA